MTSILITGSSRGIGLELVKKLAAHPDHPNVIFATCRDPSKAQELTSLSSKYPFVKVLKLDVEKIDTYFEAVSLVSSVLGEKGLNILVNNAGVAHRVTVLEDVTFDKYVNTIQTNVIAPVFISQAFLPLLKKSAALKSDSATGIRQVAILNISSKLGSMSLKQEFVVWGYNESKAALNQITRSLSSNLSQHGIIATSIHPGWVRTDMGGPEAPLSLDESVSGLMNIIYNLSPAYNDKFLCYDGSEIPW